MTRHKGKTALPSDKLYLAKVEWSIGTLCLLASLLICCAVSEFIGIFKILGIQC